MATLTDEELEKIAKQNLAAEDTSVSKVNAAARLGALPGVGAAGSTPETDQTNLNLAAAMSRGDLGNRFGFGSPQYQQGTETPEVPQPQPSQIDIEAVNQRRNSIIQGIDPDAPALVPNAKRKAQMYDELGALTHVAHAHVLEQGRIQDALLSQQKNMESAQQFIQLASGIGSLTTEQGTPEHRVAVAQLAHDNFLGAATAAGQKLLATEMGLHKDKADLKKAIADYKSATGFEPASIETTATGGVNLRGRAGETKIPTPVATRYARLQAAVSGHEELSKKEETENVKAGKADVPYSQTEKYHRDQTELSLLESRFPSLAKSETKTATASPQTDIITKGGHHYEVDHVNKRVIRQID